MFLQMNTQQRQRTRNIIGRGTQAGPKYPFRGGANRADAQRMRGRSRRLALLFSEENAQVLHPLRKHGLRRRYQVGTNLMVFVCT